MYKHIIIILSVVVIHIFPIFKFTEQLTTDNVGESGGEESEDEWNYIKVDKKDEIAEVEAEEKISKKEIVEELNEAVVAPSESAESQEAYDVSKYMYIIHKMLLYN